MYSIILFHRQPIRSKFFIGIALQCWKCDFGGDPSKACLKAGADPNIDNKTFTVETCLGQDAGCVKMQMRKLD